MDQQKKPVGMTWTRQSWRRLTNGRHTVFSKQIRGTKQRYWRAVRDYNGIKPVVLCIGTLTECKRAAAEDALR